MLLEKAEKVAKLSYPAAGELFQQNQGLLCQGRSKEHFDLFTQIEN